MTVDVRPEPRDAPHARPGSGRARLAGALTLLAVLAGVGYRLALLLWDAPPTNSDEATMGLAALHIARGQELPIWFYGQAYMGTLEAYLAAPVLARTGPSVLGLRLPTLALYALFAVLAWRLTLRLTGDRWFALLVVVLLAFGSDRIVKNQLIAGGGYPEMNTAGAALALLAYDLCAGRPRRRLPRWAAWGLLAGLMLWVDPLVLPYVVAIGAVLLVVRWREVCGRAGATLGLAALVGAAPLLGHSLTTGRNPLTAVLAAGGADAPAGWADRLHGGLLLGPPLGMGFCSPGHCATWQLWWAVALPVLLVAGAVSAGRALRAPAGGGVVGDGAGPAPAGRVAGALRLALLLAAAATLAVYVASSASARTPVESSRYLSCLLISVPALLWPLWSAVRRRHATTPRPGSRAEGAPPTHGTAGSRLAVPARVAAVGATVVLAAAILTTGYATWRAAGTAPGVRAAEARHTDLVATLRDLGVHGVYAGYWTCNRLTFASGEDIICAVVDDELRPGFDRYPAYRRAVAASPAPAWVAPTGSPLAARLDDRMRATPGGLDLVAVDGYRVYLPRA